MTDKPASPSPPLPDDVAALVAQIKLCVSRSDVGFAVRSALESAAACIERQARALALHERNFEALGEANRRAETAESALAGGNRPALALCIAALKARSDPSGDSREAHLKSLAGEKR